MPYFWGHIPLSLSIQQGLSINAIKPRSFGCRERRQQAGYPEEKSLRAEATRAGGGLVVIQWWVNPQSMVIKLGI
jgi:hypothetical protein